LWNGGPGLDANTDRVFHPLSADQPRSSASEEVGIPRTSTRSPARVVTYASIGAVGRKPRARRGFRARGHPSVEVYQPTDCYGIFSSGMSTIFTYRSERR